MSYSRKEEEEKLQIQKSRQFAHRRHHIIICIGRNVPSPYQLDPAVTALSPQLGYSAQSTPALSLLEYEMGDPRPRIFYVCKAFTCMNNVSELWIYTQLLETI